MSRAFVKEDVDVAERSARQRVASGLPPGALNYITLEGHAALQVRLEKLRSVGNANEIAHLEDVLRSVAVVSPKPDPTAVVFGVIVTLQLKDGTQETFRIAGVDELDLDPRNVSWVSTRGRALLGAEPGQRVYFPGEEKIVRRVVEIG